MASRKHRRYANVLLNSPTGAHLRAQPLPTVVAVKDQNRSSGEGVIFNFYATNGTPVDPIYGPSGNIWFSIGGSVGEFIIGNNTIQQCPGTSGLAQEIISDNDGHVWFGISWGPKTIGSSTPGCDVVTYPTAGWTNDVVLGPDGNVYFSETAQCLGRATPGGKITEFTTSFGTNDPIVGPDGNIWFGENGPKVGRLNVSSGTISEWDVKAGVGSDSLIVGPGGSVWFGTDLVIGRITPAGQVEQYDINRAGAFNLLNGPDGNVWFGCQFAAQVGKVTMDGQVSLYNINDTPMGMVFGTDNKLYVAQLTYYLAVVDLGGNVTEHSLTGAVPYPPHVGPDGNVWFSGNPWQSPTVSPFVGRITPNGILTEFPLSAYPNGFLNGTDGTTMYMTMNTYRFGVVTLSR